MFVEEYTGGPNPFVQDGSAAVYTAGGQYPSVTYTTGSVAGDLLWSVGGGLAGCYGEPTVGSPFTRRQWDSCNGADSDDGIASGVAANTAFTATCNVLANIGSYAVIVGFEAP
jgi:hypothetical protein